jgi:hypothetical protein
MSPFNHSIDIVFVQEFIFDANEVGETVLCFYFVQFTFLGKAVTKVNTKFSALFRKSPFCRKEKGKANEKRVEAKRERELAEENELK